MNGWQYCLPGIRGVKVSKTCPGTATFGVAPTGYDASPGLLVSTFPTPDYYAIALSFAAPTTLPVDAPSP